MPLNHPGLHSGWWGVERHDQAIVRWTEGDAAIPVGALGGRLLEVTAGRLDAYLEEAEAVSAARAVPLTADRSIGSWREAYG